MEFFLQGTVLIKSANELMDFSKGEESQTENVSLDQFSWEYAGTTVLFRDILDSDVVGKWSIILF